MAEVSEIQPVFDSNTSLNTIGSPPRRVSKAADPAGSFDSVTKKTTDSDSVQREANRTKVAVTNILKLIGKIGKKKADSKRTLSDDSAASGALEVIEKQIPGRNQVAPTPIKVPSENASFSTIIIPALSVEVVESADNDTEKLKKSAQSLSESLNEAEPAPKANVIQPNAAPSNAIPASKSAENFPAANTNDKAARQLEILKILKGEESVPEKFTSNYKLGDLLGDGAFGFVLTASCAAEPMKEVRAARIYLCVIVNATLPNYIKRLIKGCSQVYNQEKGAGTFMDRDKGKRTRSNRGRLRGIFNIFFALLNIHPLLDRNLILAKSSKRDKIY